MRNLTPLSFRRGRRGSILILVVALLVLLALIGTAYLTSTQTERQTASQATVNVQADLQLEALAAAANEEAVRSLLGTNPAGYAAYMNPNVPANATAVSSNLYGGQPRLRYPGQESDTPPNTSNPNLPLTGYAATQVSSYSRLTSTQTDPFLSERVPTQSIAGTTGWRAISWPPFPDANGNYVFENPFDAAVNLGPATNRPFLSYLPVVKTVNGKLYPAMAVVVTPATAGPKPVGLPGTAAAVGPGNLTYSSGSIPLVAFVTAGSASGDGVADGMMFKMPGGPVDGVTYYGVMRVIDNNSAVNASSAWDANPAAAMAQASTTAFTDLTVDQGVATTQGNPLNYGFFKANVDLANMLNPFPVAPAGSAYPAPTAQQELYMLNRYRFGGLAPTFNTSTLPTGVIDMRSAMNLATAPVDDLVQVGLSFYRSRSDFTWFSSSEALDVLLTERPGNPGVTQPPVGALAPPRMRWLGWDEAANLAYRFTLHNPAAAESPLETALQNELVTGQHTVPFAAGSAANSGAWALQFAYGTPTVFANAAAAIPPSLRPLLTAADPVSNAIPSRYSNPTGLPGSPWVTGVQYQFGDWVTGRDGRAYVCTLPHVSSNGASGGGTPNDPVPTNWMAATADQPLPPTPAAVGLWAGVRVGTPTNVYTPQNTSGTNPSRAGLPFAQVPVKVSVNTGTFDQLWLAYCQVMADSVSVPPNATVSASNLPQWLPPMKSNNTTAGTAVNSGDEPQMPMWRSVVRELSAAVSGGSGTVVQDTTMTPTGIKRLSPAQMLKLRAAIAAVNAMDLRDSDDDLTSRRIILNDSAGNPAYEAEVFGTEVQPFIGSVYAHVDATTPANNFVAVQLLNPYDVPITVDPASGWRFGLVNRVTPTGGGPNRLSMTDLSVGKIPFVKFTIPAKVGNVAGSIVVESLATKKPVGYVEPTSTAVGFPVAVDGLESAIGLGEVFLMRPRLYATAAASLSPSTRTGTGEAPYGEYYNEPTNIADLAPVDQIDLSLLVGAAAGPQDYFYSRVTDPAAAINWTFVYPGKPTGAYGLFVQIPPPAGLPIQMLTAVPSYPLVLNNTYMGGPNRLVSPTGVTPSPFHTPQPSDVSGINRSPFGAFARNGDLLQVPFIGGYRLRVYDPTNITGANPNAFLEMNSVTADALLAEDTTVPVVDKPMAAVDVTTTPMLPLLPEQIGRFCPVGDPTAGTLGHTNDAAALDFAFPTDPAIGTNPYWHYHWSARLFEYLTVRSPADDYYPNYDPTATDSTVGPPIATKYLVSGSPTPTPVPVPNVNIAVANNIRAGTSEETVGTEGLININTASVQVLATLPFTNVRSTNYDIANGIVMDRNMNGPFRSIFDLYRVQAVQAQTAAMVTPLPPAIPDPYNYSKIGLFSPGGIVNFDKSDVMGGVPTTAQDDGAGYDFQKRFIMLNRVSNLITTRSDTFTCYLLVQGYRGVGTSTPTLVVERRKAFFIDRNAITATNSRPVNHPIPTE